MKKVILTLFIITIPVFLLYTQAQTVCDSVFFKEFSANGNLEPYATRQLSGGEILAAGKASVSGSSSYKAMAVKFSASGTILWSFQTGGSVDDRFTGIVELSDNSYMLYGTTASFGYPQGKILLVRVSNTGAIMWSRQLGTASPGREQLKGLLQYSDGDLAGVFNVDDSTAQSDPVVFKIGLDGTLRWARRLNNGGAESLNSIAFEGSKIFVSGFYTAARKRGLLAQLNSTDGALLASQNIYHNDTVYNHEVEQMEIINHRLSYGLKMQRAAPGSLSLEVILIQSDPEGTNKTFQTRIDLSTETTYLIYKRTLKNGFVFLRNRYGPAIAKVNMYNTIDWSRLLAQSSFNTRRHFGMDITKSDGTVSAGYYSDLATGNQNRMVLTKTDALGNIGGCTPSVPAFNDTVTLLQAPFVWSSTALITPEINQPLSLAASAIDIQSANICDTVYCTDTTSLPPECNKTLFTEYASGERLVLRDVVSTSDGGRIGVGTMHNSGWLVKFKNNSDVEWSRQADQFDHNHDFLRVIRLQDNSIIAFANDYTIVNHGAYRTVRMLKLDNNGAILSVKELSREYSGEIADAAPAPDGGFVIIINAAHGLGYLYSYVIRFDASFSVIWKKEIKHFVLTPIYRSLYCNQNGVWLGHDCYDNFSQETIGIHKLDFTTGNDVWKKRFLYPNSLVRFNRIMVSMDTVYAFAYKTTLPFGPTRMLMMKLNDDGSLVTSLLLQTDPVLYPPNSYNYIDAVRPTVTLTPQNDFVMSNQVWANNTNSFNISRFSRNGEARWSRNYPLMGKNSVYNIHHQGTGTVVVGTVNKPNQYSSFYSNAFMLKTDSMGLIINGVSGVCAFENRAFLTQPDPPNEVDPRIDSVVNMPALQIGSTPMLQLSRITDASLYCHEQSSCTPVNLVQNPVACSRLDTFTFYLANNSCGVSAQWRYDTTYFALVHLSADTLKLLPKRTGTSMVMAEVEDDCSVRVLSDTVTVSPAAASVNLGADTVICTGNGAVILRAGSGYQSYRWNDNSTDSTLTVNAPGLYFVTVTDFCGGTSADSVMISLVGADFMITGVSEKCNADTVTLLATAGYMNYIWGPASYINATGNTARVNPPATTQYHVRAEKFPGCFVRDTFALSVKTSPSLQIGNDTSVCYNQPVTFTARSGFVQYLWNTGSTSDYITVTAPATYSIRAVYTNNCISRDTVQLLKHPFVFPSLGPDTALCNGTVYQLRPGNYVSYLWSNNTANSSISVGQAGTYWVRVTDMNGCTATDSVRVLLKECLKGFFMPTAFSPNKDGVNDVLKPMLYGNIKKYEFSVYNRWGQIVFSATNPANGWDGTLNGQSQGGGVFAWTCVYQFEGEPLQHKKGTVVLVR